MHKLIYGDATANVKSADRVTVGTRHWQIGNKPFSSAAKAAPTALLLKTRSSVSYTALAALL